MKTAVIISGACRYSSVTSPTWVFPFDADYYLVTWNLTQHTYTPELYSADKEIEYLRNVSNIKFKEILIFDYLQYHREYKGHPAGRVFYLYKQIYDKIENIAYERIIIFRPDLYLQPQSEITKSDFLLNDNTTLVLGMHTPDSWIKDDIQCMEDQLFCVSWNTFSKIANYFWDVLKVGRISVHSIWYNFFKDNGIEIELLLKYRSVIIRKNAADEIKNGHPAEYDYLVDKFMELCKSDDYKGKFVKTSFIV